MDSNHLKDHIVEQYRLSHIVDETNPCDLLKESAKVWNKLDEPLNEVEQNRGFFNRLLFWKTPVDIVSEPRRSIKSINELSPPIIGGSLPPWMK